MSQAYRYLANYYLARRQLDDAYATAQKCAEFTEVSFLIHFSKKIVIPFFFCSKHHVYLIHGIKSKYGGAIQYSLSVFQSILTIFFNRRRNQRIYLGCIRVKDLWFKPSLPKVLSEFLSFWELLQSF